ncbi:DUF504 domain-containing protein [Candidatus Woesearchaeota archaeon]|nr:DUF504 domain-containing protein [Candidatus Woesearchaeota archaeon]
MQTIKDLINKIKYDKRENPIDYTLFYYDRVSGKKVKIRYNDIIDIQGYTLVLEKNNREVYIPMHRIREVRRKGVLIWQRKTMKH